MSICLKLESYPEFFSSKENAGLLDAYLDGQMGEDAHAKAKDEIGEFFKDKNFFQINKANMPIGFGAYAEEEIEGEPTFMLYEFFVDPKFRDVSQLYEIKRQLIIAIRILGKALWACCVDNEDEKKIRAYQKLGFQRLYDDDYFLYMGMQIEEL